MKAIIFSLILAGSRDTIPALPFQTPPGITSLDTVQTWRPVVPVAVKVILTIQKPSNLSKWKLEKN